MSVISTKDSNIRKNKIPKDILVIEDNYDICEMIRDILGEQGYNVSVARNTQFALESLSKSKPNAIILDIWLEGNHLDGVGLLKKLKQLYPEIPVIMISGHASVELAASTIKLGAYDFIEKPFKTDRLLVVVKRALEVGDLMLLNSYLRQNLTNDQFYLRISDGASKQAKLLRQKISELANSNCRFIIAGEFGSQAANIAREIHDASQRSQNPFAVINGCRDDDLKSLIFGNDNEQSIFERINGGTLLIENINSIPLHIQSNLLDVIQKDAITRGNKTIKFDVRIIASFEIDGDNSAFKFVENGELNEMLFHRFNIKSMQIPPLRQRLDDIMTLFENAIKSKIGSSTKLDIEGLKYALHSYKWPCNTQELCNIAEHVIIAAKSLKTEHVTVDMLNYSILGSVQTDLAGFTNITAYLEQDYKTAKRHFDIEYIRSQLKRFSNNVAKTARFMGVDRAALYRKIRTLLGVNKFSDRKIIQLLNNAGASVNTTVAQEKEEATM